MHSCQTTGIREGIKSGPLLADFPRKIAEEKNAAVSQNKRKKS